MIEHDRIMARLAEAQSEIRRLEATTGPRVEMDVWRISTELHGVSAAILGADGLTPCMLWADSLLPGVEHRLAALRALSR